MSKSRDLPIGWTNRGNASDSTEVSKGGRPGDWREMDLVSKYASKKLKEEGDEKSRVPIGFSNRTNTATLEELSLSSSAFQVALAEVGLKRDLEKQPNQGLGYVKPYSDSNPVQSTSTVASSSTNKDSLPQAQSTESLLIGTGGDQMMMNLIQAVLQMDARIKVMESNLERVLDRQEKILNALSISKSTAT